MSLTNHRTRFEYADIRVLYMKYNFFIKCTESFPQMVLAIFGGLMPGIFDFFIANKNFPKICFIELVKRHPKNDFSFFLRWRLRGRSPFFYPIDLFYEWKRFIRSRKTLTLLSVLCFTWNIDESVLSIWKWNYVYRYREILPGYIQGVIWFMSFLILLWDKMIFN